MRQAVSSLQASVDMQVMITDTAGLRETEDAIEAEGVARAQQAARNSNIVIAVADASDLDLDAPWIDSLSPPQSLVDEAVDGMLTAHHEHL